MDKPKTRSQVMAEDVSALIRARYPLLWIVTNEEKRVEDHLVAAAEAALYVPRMWDVAQGVTDSNGKKMDAALKDPGTMLEFIERSGDGGTRGVWIMRDLAPWVAGPLGITTVRALRNLVRKLPSLKRDNAQMIIVLSTTAEIPPELAGQATVIEWPMPDRAEIEAILDSTLRTLDEDKRELAINGSRDAAIDAAMGLSGEQAAACYAKSLVVGRRRIEPRMVAQEKKRIIEGLDGLEWYDPLPGGLDAVGGLNNLKEWLLDMAMAYTPTAQEYGLPAPRGALLLGHSGCGKSLTAKAVATAWGIPLLRLDLNAIKSKFVGDSEGKLRAVLGVIDVVGRCVVWLDEIEKMISGGSDSSSDGGVSSDALGTFLSWAQERKGEAFLLATANDVSKLPPELMRKGRFDEIWFVDLPTRSERVDIVIAALAAHGRGSNKTVDLVAVANACVDFTGAEVAALVPTGMRRAFRDGGREPTTEDLLLAAKATVPLAKTAAEKVATLREWAKGRAQPATTPETATSQGVAWAVDLD